MPEDVTGAGWAHSRWMRRRYYIEGGYIRPVPSSALTEYDPFAVPDDGEAAEPHRLYRELVGLDPENTRAVEDFASRWGLLGLFHDRLHSDLLWSSQAETAVSIELKPSRGGELSQYKNYLPDLARTPEMPAPDGARSWRVFILTSCKRWDYLAEPLEEYGQAVSEIRRTFEACRDWRRGQGREDTTGSLKLQLDRYISQVHPVAVPPHQGHGPLTGKAGKAGEEAPAAAGWSRGWAFPSLLSAAYLMLFLDFTSGRHLQFCANETCGKPFAGDRPDRIYCSVPCKHAQQQRVFRRSRAKGARR